ncbi:hypothetical protein EDM52_06545 [Brevibacillus invocatus]|uniref:Uncharacterized protein n=1 Tax=Brevibacillus invocatus TaxID=173959 RepID=A0A3M8CIQ9_9BACL|nr:hypothetical protein EDM52_06545 [Brevibacillus invocatus]
MAYQSFRPKELFRNKMAIPFHFDDKKTSFCLIMSDAGFAFPPQIRYFSSLFSRYVVCPAFRKAHHTRFAFQFLTIRKLGYAKLLAEP